MLLIMFYEIYFIKQYFFRFINVNNFILSQLRPPPTTSANTHTLKSEMILNNNYEVDFRQNNSINSLLGFKNKLYTSAFNESANMVNILTINSILVNIDIISGSYVNCSTYPQFARSFHMSLPGLK